MEIVESKMLLIKFDSIKLTSRSGQSRDLDIMGDLWVICSRLA